MKKLIKGIVDFRRHTLPSYRETFAKLALGQRPDSLFIACSDSRVAPNVFASTDPGDLFVVRNVGNMVPTCDAKGVSRSDESEAAAIEFALGQLNVKDIIVCGHSECGAMQALTAGRMTLPHLNLRSWLRHGDEALDLLKTQHEFAKNLAPHNRLSQLNVLQQLLHLQTYPVVRQRLKNGTLKLHGWWFELKNAEVYAYEEKDGHFVLIDEAQAERLLSRLS